MRPTAPRPTRLLLHLRHLVGARRSAGADARLAVLLAAVAGAANAGGFIALGEYASHMTGYLSQAADGVALGRGAMIWTAVRAVLAFTCGAALAPVLIGWARARRPRALYAAPLAVQGGLLLGLAALGLLGPDWDAAEVTLLCFVMGLQNATITRISGAVIRTTHATGMVTDLGIELGCALGQVLPFVEVRRPDWGKVRLFGAVLAAFVAGGIVGGLGYGAVGTSFSAPLGALLLAIAVPRLAAGRRRAADAGGITPPER
ncbi:YoaK family protein [Rhodovulum sp. DZ06]|uniref:YoaK family protein n=1 Tax=Rhodovulum sp. DZ06 TaxID=3425126 RepID=UPI003D341806